MDGVQALNNWLLSKEQKDFIKTEEIISPTELFEKFRNTEEKALLSVQANIDFAKNAMSELLENLSYRALNIENDNIQLEFTDASNLITTLIDTCLDKDNGSFNFDQRALERLKEVTNNYRYAFDLSFLIR